MLGPGLGARENTQKFSTISVLREHTVQVEFLKTHFGNTS